MDFVGEGFTIIPAEWSMYVCCDLMVLYNMYLAGTVVWGSGLGATLLICNNLQKDYEIDRRFGEKKSFTTTKIDQLICQISTT
jgi:hypothetical protein